MKKYLFLIPLLLSFTIPAFAIVIDSPKVDHIQEETPGHNVVIDDNVTVTGTVKSDGIKLSEDETISYRDNPPYKDITWDSVAHDFVFTDDGLFKDTHPWLGWLDTDSNEGRLLYYDTTGDWPGLTLWDVAFTGNAYSLNDYFPLLHIDEATNNWNFDPRNKLLYLDKVNKRVGIGTAAPNSALNVVSTADASINCYGSTYSGMFWEADGPVELEGHTYSADTPFVWFYSANGTKAKPTAVADERELGWFGVSGYDGSDPDAGYSYISYIVDGTVSTGVVPIGIKFFTTKTDGTTDHEAMYIGPDGTLAAGATTITAAVVQQLKVRYDAANSFYIETDNAGDATFCASGKDISFSDGSLTTTGIVNFPHAQTQPARSLKTTYQNTTGHPIIIYGSIEFNQVNDANDAYAEGKTDDGDPPNTVRFKIGMDAQAVEEANDPKLNKLLFFMAVADDDYYTIDDTTTGAATATLLYWNEVDF